MIVNEKKTIGRTPFNYFYSDARKIIELYGALYEEIYMPEGKTVTPTETEIPIEEEE